MLGVILMLLVLSIAANIAANSHKQVVCFKPFSVFRELCQWENLREQPKLFRHANKTPKGSASVAQAGER